MPRSHKPGQRVDTSALVELPDLQEFSLEELEALPDEARHFILMRAGKVFMQEQDDYKKNQRR